MNLAVEASTLHSRKKHLLQHDEFIADHIGADDILIVSIGGNDIALRPRIGTIISMLLLAWFTPKFLIQRGWALPLFFLRRLFKTQVERYVSRLVAKQKPKMVVVCMIYFPLELQARAQPSWADIPLKLLGYNRWPGRLQAGIRAMYELATRKIQVEGVEVFPAGLFEVLDGKRGEDYEARVEPSAEGGSKIASYLMGVVGPLINDAERAVIMYMVGCASSDRNAVLQQKSSRTYL